MKNKIAITLACLAAAFVLQSAVAATAPATSPAPQKSAVAGKKSLAEKGSYHLIHAKKGKLDCEDCHNDDGPLPDNTVMLRLHDKLAKSDPGPVDHGGCLTCHKDLGDPKVNYKSNKKQ